MKKYNYEGNLYKDIKKAKKKIDGKYFFKHMLIQFIGMMILGAILRVCGFIGNLTGYIGAFVGVSIGQGIGICISRAKENSRYYLNKISDLYSDINLTFYDRTLSMERMKEAIILQKKERVIEETDTMIPILSNEEKIVTYFYLLNPEDKIQVLRQIKDNITNEYSDIYLLEDKDLQRENIEIPLEKINKLKAKRN